MRKATTTSSNRTTACNHFSSRLLEDLLAYLEERLSRTEFERVRMELDEQHCAAATDGSSQWLSYDELKRLLRVGARVLGGTDELRLAGASVLRTKPAVELLQALQTLGSPDAVYAAASMLSENIMPFMRFEIEEVGSHEWLVTMSLPAGVKPLPGLCSLSSGYWMTIPAMFGHDSAEVVEETCQCTGAPACRLRFRWQEADEEVRSRRFAQLRAHLLQARLESFQDLVADLASGEGSTIEVLRRIMLSAMHAVAAPQCALLLDGAGGKSAEILTEGLDEEASARALQKLKGDRLTDDSRWHVIDMASGLRHYGRLAIIDPNHALFEQASELIDTYVRLAASFLDNRTGLEESRRQATTAHSLLELSSALAELATPDEMALKLARAIPGVIGCERALVYLVDPGARSSRLAASQGYGEDALAELNALASPTSMVDAGAPSAGLAAMIAEGETVGWVLASAGESSTRDQRDDVELGERLKGLAAQGATAVSNARLLDRIRHQALHDALTGLANRVLILDRVEQMLARSRRNRLPTAALYIDLDGFKSVNDTLGHDAGDALLRAVSARLTITVRDADTVGRLGGDEFVVLVDGATVDASPELIAERLLTVLAEPFDLGELSSTAVELTACVGIAVGNDRSSASEMLRDADIALYEAKAAGRSRFVVFEPAMQTAIQNHLLLEMDLHDALAAKQFYLVYQPMFNLGSGDITGVEALLRWRHPVRGVVQPDAFIPRLEDSGMIVEVGRWVLLEACRQAVRLHELGHRLAMSVNASAGQLETGTFAQDVTQALHLSGLDACSLIIEITETALMRDVDAVVPRLESLRALGVRIAIDDFGTGYSSLAYLQQLPVDTLKIDRSFISAMAASTESCALVHTLVQLGKTLNLETLAEGIEEHDQYSWLQREQCDSGQGYLFARPLDVDGLERFLGDGAQTPSALSGQVGRSSSTSATTAT